MKKRLLIIMLAAFLMSLVPSGAVYAAGDFIIRDYDIKMVVNEDATYQITETLDVEFTAPSHGIYRSIPRQTTLDRDGQLSKYAAGVDDFTMLSGQPFKDESDSGGYIFRIGDPKSYADTNTRYQYSYVYDTKGDHLKGADEVFHNMVGTTWEAQSIDHVSFEVVFPKDIDAGKVGVKTGSNAPVAFEAVDDRTIRGETDKDVMGGLTIRAVLPDEYFFRQANEPVVIFYIIDTLLAAVVVLGFFIWRKYGRDPVYPPTLEMYPPDDLSAPEAAYLLEGELSKQDVVSILLSLADRGYLRIREFEEESGKKRKKKTAYEIDKLREYDGDTIGERTFMAGLFESGDTVNVKDLEDKFYKTIEVVEKEIEDKYKDMLYDKTADSKSKILYAAGWIGVIVLYAVSNIVSGYGYSVRGITLLIYLLSPCFLTGGGFYIAAKVIRDKKGPKSFIPAVIVTALGMFIGGISKTTSGPLVMPFYAGLALCLMLFIMGGLCEKKTEYYAELQARIKGYTDFLKTAEKDQMDELADKDPGYYYRNLAYAFALGVTAVYAKRFAGLASTPPDWYDSHHISGGSYTTSGMLDSINSMASSVSTSMSSSPSSGSGGGSFSGGGGGGGGGGGSW